MENKLEIVEEMAKRDVQYQQMLHTCTVLERRFDQMCKTLTDEQRGIAWEYVMIGEDMSRRMLELACEI